MSNNHADEPMQFVEDLNIKVFTLPDDHPITIYAKNTDADIARREAEIGTLLAKIVRKQASMKKLKKDEKLLKTDLGILKKRREACDKAVMIDQKISARNDKAIVDATLLQRQNAHVPGECDALTTRGVKCTRRGKLAVVDGKNHCPSCLMFKLAKSGYSFNVLSLLTILSST